MQDDKQIKSNTKVMAAVPEEALEPMGSEAFKDDGSARGRLIEVARGLFAETGLDGTSTRDIAKAANVNVSLISYYFGGKEGLYKAVITEFANTASSRMNLLLDTIDLENLNKESFRAALRTLLSGMIPHKYMNREINILIQREMMAGLPHAKEVFENTFVKLLERVVGIYKTGQAKGIVKKELNPYLIFLSLVHSTDMFMQMGNCTTGIDQKVPQLPRDLDAYIEQIYILYVEGVMV